jgi:S1-C subfamily serine protease
MRILSLLLIAALSSACAVASAGPVSPLMPSFIDSVRPLQIAGETICTATSINDRLDLWLTAAHCVTDGDELYAGETIDGFDAVVVAIDLQNDLAILQAAGTQVAALEVSSVKPSAGDHIRMYGFPVGNDGDLFQGYVSNAYGYIRGYDYPVMRFDMTSCGGNSGSAVVNDAGKIISVLQFGYGPGCSGYTGGATWESLTSLIGISE